MPFYRFDGHTPVVDETAFVHPLACVIGDVAIGPRCYIGPGASLRGDFGPIVLELESNLQDNCVIHTFPGQPVVLRERSHIGHAAILHGCKIGRNALIGMNAVIMDGADIGEDSFVGAQSFVKSGDMIPPRSLAIGSPARVIRALTGSELNWKRAGTDEYVELASRCLVGLAACEPLRSASVPSSRRVEQGFEPLHGLKSER